MDDVYRWSIVNQIEAHYVSTKTHNTGGKMFPYTATYTNRHSGLIEVSLGVTQASQIDRDILPQVYYFF